LTPERFNEVVRSHWGVESAPQAHTRRRFAMNWRIVSKLRGRWRKALRSRLSGAGFKPPQAAAVKSRGGEHWGQSAEAAPRAGRDQRDERKWTSVDASLSRDLSSKPGAFLSPGTSVPETWLLGMRRPAY